MHNVHTYADIGFDKSDFAAGTCNRLQRLIFVHIQIFHSCQCHVQFRNVKMNERLTVRRACLLLKIRHDKKSEKKMYPTMISEFYRKMRV